MKNKKALFFLAVVMMLTFVLPAPALAKSNTRTTKIRAKCMLPQIAIEVTVPTATNAYLNPSRVSIKSNGTISNGQVVSDLSYIENKSLVAIEVSASVSGKVKSGSNMTLSTASTAGSSSTAKTAFVYFEIQSATSPDAVSWDSGYNESRHIVLSPVANKKEKMITLGAGDEDDRYGVFRLTGDCIANPTKAWTTRDGFIATIMFTFNPTVR